MHITSALVGDQDLQLQVQCIRGEAVAFNANTNGKRASHAPLQSVQCSLSITMYGPMELFDSIGDFFDSYDMFIQDPPARCDRRVRYRNPHRLSSIASDSCLWTSHFDDHFKLAEMKAVTPRPELLDLFDPQNDLAEAPQPLAITTSLKR